MDALSTGGAGRTSHGVSSRQKIRTRTWAGRGFVALCVLLTTCAVTIGAVATSAAPAGAAAGPACTFPSPSFSQLVLNVSLGESLHLHCTGMGDDHPYLLIEASLLVAIDPAAAPLLQGKTTSLPGLLAVISALPELNPLSVAFPESNSSGVLDTNYTVPTSQPPDPNATCPPSAEQLASGLIGCAVAMIDLETFKPVVPGTMVLNFKGDPLFPLTNPTVGLSTTTPKIGQRVTVSDAKGAKSYWWLATLVDLESNLGGGTGGAGPIPVLLKVGGHKATGSVTPATYNGSTFTPPKLSGSFIATGHGKKTVHVTLSANLLGFGLSIAGSAKLKVSK
jgi:hypothetical protein